jgi:cob(I)alamin adenosyltransferase
VTDRDGYVHVYYGDGKGKSTAAVGLAVRAAGHGHDVAVYQFMKGHDEVGEPYGEVGMLRDAGVAVSQYPTRHVRDGAEFTDAERDRLLAGLRESETAARSGDCDLVVLDEVTLLAEFDVVDPERLVAAVSAAAPGVEVVATGRTAPDALVEAADYATEMTAVAHPFEDGVGPRAGIEY